jgi:hypothetical protein
MPLVMTPAKKMAICMSRNWLLPLVMISGTLMPVWMKPSAMKPLTVQSLTWNPKKALRMILQLKLQLPSLFLKSTPITTVRLHSRLELHHTYMLMKLTQCSVPR